MDLILRVESPENVFVLPREDIALAFAVGASLSGREVLVHMGMQGFAASMDALTSLCSAHQCAIPIVTAHSATDELGLHHKRPIGRALLEIIESLGLNSVPLTRDPTEAEVKNAVAAVRAAAMDSCRPAILLLESEAANC